MGANNTSAMLAAGIAVTGTIFGALIAALTQMAVARRTSRSQREAVSLQYQNDNEKNLRMERQKIFVEFLLSVDALVNLRVQCEAHHADADSSSGGPIPPLPGTDKMDRAGDRMWKAYRSITLLSGKLLQDLAHQYGTHHQERAQMAHENQPQPGRPDGVTAGALTRLMRQELGVTGGKEVNMDTGLYKDPISRGPETAGSR